jgi:hypothetical protein
MKKGGSPTTIPILYVYESIIYLFMQALRFLFIKPFSKPKRMQNQQLK